MTRTRNKVLLQRESRKQRDHQQQFPVDELGWQINRARLLNEREKDGGFKRWIKVMSILVSSLILINAMLLLILEFAISPAIPTPNTDKHYEEFDNPYDDIVKDTVPFVQKWYESRTNGNGAGTIPPLLETKHGDLLQPWMTNDRNHSSSCLDYFFETVQEFIPETSPSYVKLVLQNLGDTMYHSPLIRHLLQDLLMKPQNLTSFYADSKGCLGTNHAFVELACATRDHVNLDLDDFDTKTKLEYSVNVAVVLDVLTLQMERDIPSLFVAIDAMMNSRRRAIENLYVELFGEQQQKEYLEFLLAKYRGMAEAFHRFGKAMAENKNMDAVDSLLQINILEAVKLDIINGYTDNAQVGLALAAATRYGSYTDSNTGLMLLGKEWVDAYLAWNFAFITGSLLSPAYSKLGKLLIPSISCTNGSELAGQFMQRRVISLALNMMHIYKAPRTTQEGITLSNIPDITEEKNDILEKLHAGAGIGEDEAKDVSSLSKAMGRSNLQNVIVTEPDVDTVQEMFYRLCAERCHEASWVVLSNSNPISWLTDENFLVYAGFVVWVTAIMTGFGLEFFFVATYLQNDWTSKNEVHWKLAQFLFSIFAVTSLGLATFRNYLALPFLVLGCWKFGHPETVSFMYSAIYDFTLSKTQRLAHALDSIGLCIHHAASSLVICMLLAGVARPDRSVYDPILVLSIQHLFVLLKYWHQTLYICIEFLLEIWFEWTVLSNFELYGANHWTVELAALSMLVAHWIYLFAAGMTLFGQSESWISRKLESRGRKKKVHQISTSRKQGNRSPVQSALTIPAGVLPMDNTSNDSAKANSVKNLPNSEVWIDDDGLSIGEEEHEA